MPHTFVEKSFWIGIHLCLYILGPSQCDCAGFHRADRRGTGKRLQAIPGFSISCGNMYHRLLIARLVVTKFRHLLQRLADSRNIAMTKDAKTPGEKRLLNAVALYILVFEKGDDGLGHRHTPGCLVAHACSPFIPNTAPWAR